MSKATGKMDGLCERSARERDDGEQGRGKEKTEKTCQIHRPAQKWEGCQDRGG